MDYRLTKRGVTGGATLRARPFWDVSQATINREIRDFEPFAKAVERLAEYEDMIYGTESSVTTNTQARDKLFRTWHNDYVSGCPDRNLDNALLMGVKALEARIAQKPKIWRTVLDNRLEAYCPSCGKRIMNGNYCSECGQRIGWDDNLSNSDK